MTEKTMVMSAWTGTPTASATVYGSIGGFQGPQGTEVQTQVNGRVPGTARNLYVNVGTNANANTATLKLRKNAVDAGIAVTVAGGATGQFSDTSNTASFADGDDIGFSLTNGASTSTFLMACGIEMTTTGVAQYQPTGISGAGASTTSNAVNRWMTPNGQLVAPDSVETNRSLAAVEAITLDRMQVYVSANARTATTMRSRKNAANGNQTFSVGASATGFFEDVTNSDSLAASDTFSLMAALGSGTNSMTFRLGGFRHDGGTDRSAMYAQGSTGNIAFGVTATHGWGYSTTDNTIHTPVPYTCTAGKLNVRSTANTLNGATTVSSLKNGSAGSQSISIGAGVTGVLNDPTNTDSMSAGDLIGLKFVTGGSSGVIVMLGFGVLIEATAAGGTVLPNFDHHYREMRA